MPSHRVYAKRVRAHAEGKARRRREATTNPFVRGGLKGVRVTSRPSAGLFEPLLFIGSPRSIPSPLRESNLCLFSLALSADGSRPFPPFRVAKSRKSLGEKAPQPLTGDACTGREREDARENPEKDDQDDCQRQTGKRRRRRGIQREDNAVSNVRGITMRRRKPAD